MPSQFDRPEESTVTVSAGETNKNLAVFFKSQHKLFFIFRVQYTSLEQVLALLLFYQMWTGHLQQM